MAKLNPETRVLILGRGDTPHMLGYVCTIAGGLREVTQASEMTENGDLDKRIKQNTFDVAVICGIGELEYREVGGRVVDRALKEGNLKGAVFVTDYADSVESRGFSERRLGKVEVLGTEGWSNDKFLEVIGRRASAKV